MPKLAIILISSILLCLSCRKDNVPDNNPKYGRFVAETSTQEYIVLSSYYINNHGGVWIEKINHSGELLWSKNLRYEAVDEPLFLEISQDKSIRLTSLHTDDMANERDIYFTWLDENGNLLNRYFVQGSQSPDEYGFSPIGFTKDADNNTVIIGTSSFNPNKPIEIIKISQDGYRIWDYFYGFGFARGNNIFKTMDDNFVVTGFVGDNVLLMKIDGNGDTLFTEKYQLEPNSAGMAVLETESNELLISGSYGNEDTSFGAFLMKTSANGDSLWYKKYDAHSTVIFSFIRSQNNEFIWMTENSHNLSVMAFDQAGNEIWQREISKPGYRFSGTCIQPTNDGGSVLCGHAFFDATRMIYVAKLSASGEITWEYFRQ